MRQLNGAAMNFLTLSPWHWWALTVLLLALELVAPTSFFLWPAVAAAIIGIVLWFAPHIGVLAQILDLSLSRRRRDHDLARRALAQAPSCWRCTPAQ